MARLRAGRQRLGIVSTLFAPLLLIGAATQVMAGGLKGDFNGDGFDDLAIGVPGEDVGAAGNAGAVNVIYGSKKGLRAKGDQFWHQDVLGVLDRAESADQFLA